MIDENRQKWLRNGTISRINSKDEKIVNLRTERDEFEHGFTQKQDEKLTEKLQMTEHGNTKQMEALSLKLMHSKQTLSSYKKELINIENHWAWVAVHEMEAGEQELSLKLEEHRQCA